MPMHEANRMMRLPPYLFTIVDNLKRQVRAQGVDVIDFSMGGRLNQTMIENFFHLKEDPTQPGRYYGVDAPEFTTHSAGVRTRPCFASAE